MDFDQVKKYWEERAATDNSAQSTTQDFYMREIEFQVMKKLIDHYRPSSVLDVGCGDARTTARLATEFQGIKFSGGDYSDSMVRNARDIISSAGINNLDLMLCDVTKPLPVSNLGMIYSTRCLINLPTWELQCTALENIAKSLLPGGYYVMIENFIEGHENFNRVRQDFELPKIPVREHNLYFNRLELQRFTADYFEIEEEENISSSYYLVSRVIYSKICQENGVAPDYFDVHHKYAAKLPFIGEFGPVRMVCMKRKK